MKCPECNSKSSVLETRTRASGIIDRRHLCSWCRLRFWTVQLPAKAVKSLAYDIARWEEKTTAKAERPNTKAVAEMKKMRRQGEACPAIAEKFGISVHMARYFTRLPRHKVYPSVRPKA